ncbi:MAG: ABC transporter ATP-binding protein [Chloroflexota bacterium]|nr:MAG: ABC transporter ATP-binding protein [Bellilinea sp.]
MSAIYIENLVKSYGTVRALDGLTLEVDRGSIFGFLGPNGAGKTTTIRILTGLAHPTAGHARVAGVEIGHNGALARRIGYLPEEPAFYGWMKAQEFLEYIGQLFGLSGTTRRKRAEELLEKVGLWEVRQRRIRGFSRGMRQRLGIAQALVNQPEVLFLDEPASALDPAGRRDVLELIASLSGECTVFMSTHILADVERVCDTVGIIHKGRMLRVARQEELTSAYALPVFRVEVTANGHQPLAAWAEKIGQEGMVEQVQVDGNAARIRVRDVENARGWLLHALAESGLAVERFEAVKPSLEEVFLNLVNEEVSR